MSTSPDSYDDWIQTDLACARCSLHWQGLFSVKYRAAHPAGAAIACPECFSRFGVHPAPPITTTPGVMKAFPPRHLARWPKDQQGRYLCTEFNPMPTDSPGEWVHSHTTETFQPGTRKCLNCGLHFADPTG